MSEGTKKEGTIEVENSAVEHEIQDAIVNSGEADLEPNIEQDNSSENLQEEEKKTLAKRVLSVFFELALYVAIALMFMIVVPKYVVQRTEVSGPSMENTLKNKDNILVEKLSYRFDKPDRFDIIVFYHFYDENVRDKKDEECYDYYVKRIIGLPGETVQIVDETIYINGNPLKENYGKDPINYQGVASEPFTLGDDEYFVLGDNREVSQDSRYEEVGNINKEDIVGRAWLRVYPFKKFGLLSDK
ncbi:MAG: signal peptidase I [Lachnospiraceae bacterium]|nr:signal peptidase I [Lachnospiraceae bacterium]